jgi:hypothetical protein
VVDQVLDADRRERLSLVGRRVEGVDLTRLETVVLAERI